MSTYRHRGLSESQNDSLVSNEPEGASSTSSEYDRYYWKNVHNPNKVLKMRHYFAGMEGEGEVSSSTEDALSHAKSMPSLEKWTPGREWGLAHKDTSVHELRRRYEAMEEGVGPRSRVPNSTFGLQARKTRPTPRTHPETHDDPRMALRRARSNPSFGADNHEREEYVVPERRSVVASEWKPRVLRDREPVKQEPPTEEVAEWMARASQMKARRDAKEEERLRAFEAYLREPVITPEFSSRRRRREETEIEAKHAVKVTSVAPAVVIDSVQLNDASSNSITPTPSPQRSARERPVSPQPSAVLLAEVGGSPTISWANRRYHYEVERSPIAGNFDKNRSYFEEASRAEDERLAERQDNKFMRVQETDLDAAVPVIQNSERSGLSPQSRVVIARQTSSQPLSTTTHFDPELLNPYGRDQPVTNSVVINLGQKQKVPEPTRDPPRLETLMDNVQKYVHPPPTSDEYRLEEDRRVGRPRDIADGSEVVWKECHGRQATAQRLPTEDQNEEAIYANINVIREHQQQQMTVVSQQQQNVKRHQIQQQQQHQQQQRQLQPNRLPQQHVSRYTTSQRYNIQAHQGHDELRHSQQYQQKADDKPQSNNEQWFSTTQRCEVQQQQELRTYLPERHETQQRQQLQHQQTPRVQSLQRYEPQYLQQQTPRSQSLQRNEVQQHQQLQQTQRAQNMQRFEQQHQQQQTPVAKSVQQHYDQHQHHQQTVRSQLSDERPAAPMIARQGRAPTQVEWEPARCVWDSHYHTWRRYDRATNDYIITQPANRPMPQGGTSPLTQSLRDLELQNGPYNGWSEPIKRLEISRGPAGISLPNGLTLYGQRS